MSESAPKVSVNIVIYNGERFVRHCLSAVRAQTYENVEITILDNASTDRTREILKDEYPELAVIDNPINAGMWPAQEVLLDRTDGEYVLVLSVDVIMDNDFIARAVAACERDRTIDGIQAKVYQYSLSEVNESGVLSRAVIDTCGFAMTRARRVVNVGHGQPDGAGFSERKDIFGVEGAVPFFRRSALVASKVDGLLIDPDYFWYGDDLDLAWRMTLMGHRQVFAPEVVAWHDRSTTKGNASVPVFGQLERLKIRRAIPLHKRRLDWSNVRFTIVKNDYIINILKDLPRILAREAAILGYTVLFEPAVLLEIGRFVRLLPRMLRRRKSVMAKAVLPPATIHRYFI